jgi:hypothetical protein
MSVVQAPTWWKCAYQLFEPSFHCMHALQCGVSASDNLVAGL